MIIQDLKKYKTSNRIYVLGSGRSVLDISKKEWKEIEKHDTIGFNHWYVHEHQPTFYDLSYLANDYFESKETDMFYLASKNCPDSKFIINHSLDTNHLNLFKDKIIAKTYINHFDFFDSDLKKISEAKDNEIGLLAKYWSLDFFKAFDSPHGELLPNKNYIYKSRGQLFATIQIAVLLGYKDIRLVGVDLNNENKFQDYYDNAPYSSKSIGYGGEKFKPRANIVNTVKDPKGIHNTCQGTKDADYLGIHKLVHIFEQRCLKRIGTSLTVTNDKSLLTDIGIKHQPIMGNLKIPKITFCIPSKTNLRYLKACIPSIRKNAYRKDHDIIVFVDQDEDGTVKWLDTIKDKYNIQYHINPKLGKELYGIGRAYDFCVTHSTTDIFMIFHADMMLGKNADLNAYQHLKPKTVVCSTRVEPPLHPNAGEKIIKDFGMWPEEFKEEEFDKYVESQLEETKTTEGIFAPWMMYKKEFIEILGGHDPIMHSCREDSDIFNRMLLADFKFIQPWSSLVYHLTGRGAGSFDGDKERHEQWKKDMNNSTLEFIRKWGTNVNHTPLMKPIVYPVYKKSLILKNPNPQLEQILEPWFNGGDGIIVEVDGNKFTNEDYDYIQKLPAILANSTFLEEDMGERFEVGNLILTVNDVESYEKELIKWEEK